MAASNGKPVDLRGQTDLAFPWAVRVAATWRLADLIAAGTTRLEDLAAQARVNADALGRLLHYLASRGVFAESTPGSFILTDAARLLQDSHPGRLRAWLDQDGFGGRMDRTWSTLLEAVRMGESAYPSVHGCSFWEDLAAHPALSASFNAHMAAGTAEGVDAIGTEGDQDLVTSMDLLMLVVLGGRERTLEEFGQLARTAGMTLRATHRLPSGPFLLECVAQ